MVLSKTDLTSIKNLYKKLTSRRKSDIIKVESQFQRGDEETGVWSTSAKQNYIDSLFKEYPTSIITFVKQEDTEDPWLVLDGGNRIRALRDFMDDKYVRVQDDLVHEIYTNHSEEDKATFRNINIPCQWITIESSDPPDTICEMFTRLNMTGVKLSEGELIKAHGWKCDIWEIELAKSIIHWGWQSSGVDFSDINIQELKEIWKNVIGDIKETRRCDGLATMVGFIVSAKTKKMITFDKRYKILKNEFDAPGTTPGTEQLNTIYSKIKTYLDIIGTVYSKKLFGDIKNGFISKKRSAPIWKYVCESDDEAIIPLDMITKFYKIALENDIVANQYETILNKGGNGEATKTRLESIHNFVHETMNY